MKPDKLDNNRNLSNPQKNTISLKPEMGSTKGKFPVFLDGGKTIIFISDKNREKEITERYYNRGNQVKL
jgi:hypothetical protein